MDFWLSDHAALLGLYGVALAIAVGATLIMFPLGPYEETAGTVTGFRLIESRSGSYPLAEVRLASRQVTVKLPRTQACRVGDSIHLLLKRHLWGTSAAWIACDRGAGSALS